MPASHLGREDFLTYNLVESVQFLPSAGHSSKSRVDRTKTSF